MEFLDFNVCIGQPTRRVFDPAVTADDLLNRMDKAGIARALVWHVSQFDYSPIDGNDILSDAIAGKERLFGCWALLPPQTDEVKFDGLYASMKRNRIVALRAFPEFHRFTLDRTVFGRHLDEISERRIPFLYSIETGGQFPVIYNLLKEYPNLTCVITDTGTWNTNRQTWPLLEKYPNVYLETSYVSLGAGGLEGVVERWGAERLVFGAQYPAKYFEAAMLQLLHADISDEDKKKIASGNAERLIAGVRL